MKEFNKVATENAELNNDLDMLSNDCIKSELKKRLNLFLEYECVAAKFMFFGFNRLNGVFVEFFYDDNWKINIEITDSFLQHNTDEKFSVGGELKENEIDGWAKKLHFFIIRWAERYLKPLK